MKIERPPPSRNVYWFEDVGEQQIFHLGCFAESNWRGIEVYGDLLGRLYQEHSSLWVEFQSAKHGVFNQRRRDLRLSAKSPTYQDESYLAFTITSEDDLVKILKEFWNLKELRCYFWADGSSHCSCDDIIPKLARTDYRNLARYIPSVARFAAERDMCSSYLRVMFHQSDRCLIRRLLAECAAQFNLDFLLEAAIFRSRM